MPIYRLNANDQIDQWERLDTLARNNQCGDLNYLMANQDFRARVRVQQGSRGEFIAHAGDFFAYVKSRQAPPEPLSMLTAAKERRSLEASLGHKVPAPAKERGRFFTDTLPQYIDDEKRQEAVEASKALAARERADIESRKRQNEWSRQAARYPQERSLDELRRDDTRNEAVQAVFRRWPREEGARRIKHVDAWYAGIGPVEQRRLNEDVTARREAIRGLVAALEGK